MKIFFQKQHFFLNSSPTHFLGQSEKYLFLKLKPSHLKYDLICSYVLLANKGNIYSVH